MKKIQHLVICLLVILMPLRDYGFEKSKPFANIAPILSSTGNQVYCTGGSIRIVTDFSIVDPDDNGTDFIYVQISSGYIAGQDVLTLPGVNPNITNNWNAATGILTLSGITSQPTYLQLIAAVKRIEYSNLSPTASGTKKFSISVGQANYLPSNGHYYEFKSNVGISWTAARTLAQNTTYYGLQGYLATLTSEEEAKLAGEQTTGAGWIGGTDEQVEGVWRWATGPEIGTIFWNGGINGSSPTYAKWNTSEPNNFNGNENYAHITGPGIGLKGSWNDLRLNGDPAGSPYEPKGYIVEYGGMPGDPILQIATSTTIFIPTITSSVAATNCGNGSMTLQAISNTNQVYWYENSTGGTSIWIGNTFTTPFLTATKNYFVAAFSPTCSSTRVQVTATIVPIPDITVASSYTKCGDNNFVINAQASIGTVSWFDNATATTAIFIGSNFSVPNINQTTFFYVEANNQGCLSTRKMVEVKISLPPVATDEDVVLCENERTFLDANIPNMQYEWNTNQTTQTIQISNSGTYFVKITNPEGCSVTKTFTVTTQEVPVIQNIAITNLTVTILPKNAGNYEYSIDGINFQNSNIFILNSGGSYIAYLKNECKVVKKPFSIIEMPLFFTPNNDGFNDRWIGKEINKFPKFQISIFDRYGKLITVLNQRNTSWDGSFQGSNLPADDYWIVGKTGVDDSVFKGHFSLKR